MKNPYENHPVRYLEPNFSFHMSAMTEFNLEDKADIAIQLAYRDMVIEDLQFQVVQLEEQLKHDNKLEG